LGTKRGYLSHLHNFFEWTVIEGYTRTDPTLGIELDKPRLGNVHAISTENLTKAIEKAEPRIRAMLLLAYEGLRPGEIALLRDTDIDSTTGQLHVPGRRDRIVALRQSVAEDLPNRQGYLFTLRNGSPSRPHNITHDGGRYLHRMGIRETLTSIRHRRGFDDYLKRRDLQLTQQRMGHASAASTAPYAAADAKKAAGVRAEAS
jgi:integrase